MLRIYYKKNTRLAKETDLDVLRDISMESLVWVDLQNPTIEEKITIETYFVLTSMSFVGSSSNRTLDPSFKVIAK
jgi:hypothetical protein